MPFIRQLEAALFLFEFHTKLLYFDLIAFFHFRPKLSEVEAFLCARDCLKS